MAKAKTRPTDADVSAFLAAVPDETRRADAQAVCALMAEVSGEKPVMWGDALVGFGFQHLKYASGRELDWPKLAFSPRKANLTIYINEGFDGHQDLLATLGKARTSVSCLYIKKLSDVDSDVFRELITRSYANQTG